MNDDYQGVEVGPIRPPSEAQSLMLRVTRNCPWNKCTFCGLYKGEPFSVRPLEHVMRDIDTIRNLVDQVERIKQQPLKTRQSGLFSLQENCSDSDQMVLHMVLNWMRGGMESIFLQDANSMVMKPDDLVCILSSIRQSFPKVKRITTYARSQSIARISDEDMARIASAGLNRIHIGMESAADEVLEFVKKGVDKKTHIIAGQKVKAAGIELSEYFMPGLGGARYSRQNALETADAINQINPDFIRIRTLAIPEQVELYKDVESGAFSRIGDVDMAKELLLFLENLDGVTSTIKSDHILNLLQDVEGEMPTEKMEILDPLRSFLTLSESDQLLYRVGRRTGIFFGLEDLYDPELLAHAEKACIAHQVTSENIEQFTTEMMKRFI
jgi:histone acetyltransferase (RNA polymerase elongator complex component)